MHSALSLDSAIEARLVDPTLGASTRSTRLDTPLIHAFGRIARRALSIHCRLRRITLCRARRLTSRVHHDARHVFSSTPYRHAARYAPGPSGNATQRAAHGPAHADAWRLRSRRSSHGPISHDGHATWPAEHARRYGPRPGWWHAHAPANHGRARCKHHGNEPPQPASPHVAATATAPSDAASQYVSSSHMLPIAQPMLTSSQQWPQTLNWPCSNSIWPGSDR